MSHFTGIQYLPQAKIDKAKWDDCIGRSANGLIYAWSFYLDIMAAHWDALVYNDYEAVMPLTWNKKFGISYLYQPFLTAQLGVFGKDLEEGIADRFLHAIPRSFRLTEISLNSHNKINNSLAAVTRRNNFVLPLTKPYEQLSESYSENTRRNIRKAQQSGCRADKGFNAAEVTRLALQQMKHYGQESAENANRFYRLYTLLSEKGMTNTFGIRSESGELLASCIFFFSHNRAYYILVGNHPDSRITGASHALIDSFIKDQAGSGMLLDFEGSDIPGLAAFYSGFGAVNEPYSFVKINRLPFFLRWLKG